MLIPKWFETHPKLAIETVGAGHCDSLPSKSGAGHCDSFAS